MRMLASTLVIVSCLSTALAQAGQTSAPDVQSLFLQLQNRSTSSEAAKKLTKVGGEDRTARKYISEHLPPLITTSGGEVKTNAIWLAGNLKIASALPALAALLRHFSLVGQTGLGVTARLDNDPAGKALVQIGGPSVGAVAQVLEQGDSQARWRAALVLMSIGTAAAVQAVRSHIPKEKDPHVRQFMESFFKGGAAHTAASDRK